MRAAIELPIMSTSTQSDQGLSDARLSWLTFTLVVAVSLACSLYASFDARGVYADAAGLVVVIYEMKWFFVSLSGTRVAVEIMRQAPIVPLARYTSATLF